MVMIINRSNWATVVSFLVCCVLMWGPPCFLAKMQRAPKSLSAVFGNIPTLESCYVTLFPVYAGSVAVRF